MDRQPLRRHSTRSIDIISGGVFLNLPVPDFGSGLGGTGANRMNNSLLTLLQVVAYSAQVLPEHGLVIVSWNTAFLCAAQETGAAATSFDEWQWTGNRCVGTAPGASTLSAEAFSLNLPVPDFGSGLGGTGANRMNNSLLTLLQVVAYSAQVLPEHGLVIVSWNTAFLCAAQETGAAATSFDEWQWTGNRCVGTAPGASTLSAEAFSLNLPVPDFGSGLGGTGANRMNNSLLTLLQVVAYSAQVLPEHGLVIVSWNTAFLCAAQETGAAATSFDEWQWTGNRCVGTAPGASTLSAEAFSLNLPVPDFGSGLGGTGANRMNNSLLTLLQVVAYSAQVLPEHGLVNVSWNTAFLCAAQETGAAATSFDEWQWTGNRCVGTAPGASTLSAEAFSLNLPVPDFGSGLGGTGANRMNNSLLTLLQVVAYSAQVLPEHGLVNVSWNTAFLCAAQETGAAATSFDEWQWTGNRCVGTAPGASTLSAEAFSLNLPVPDFGSGLGGTGANRMNNSLLTLLQVVAYSAQVLPEHGLVIVSWNTAFLCAAQETGAAATSFDEWQWTGNRCVGTAPGASTLSAEAFSLNLPVPDFGSGLGGTGANRMNNSLLTLLQVVAYSAQVLPEHGLVIVSWNTAFLCAAQETGAAATSFDEWQWTGNRCVGTAPGASTLSAEAFSLNLPVPDFGSGLGGTGANRMNNSLLTLLQVVAYSAQVLPEHGLVNVSWNTALLCAAQETGAAATSFDEWQWAGNRCVGTAPGASTLSAEAFS
ncbi:hypothetical protein V5799_011676 [Amblyomma americanum]|uniref:Uncharacterized protein n=1 Tax=Amblyomma americanum TaxID=6943 RepID=A0AAQ4EGI3_AMBAM